MTTRIIEWASAAFTLPGQSECGDRHVVTPTVDGALVAVVDGLGHGHEAAIAAERAVAIIEGHVDSESLISLVQRCHTNLRGTRGAVMSLAMFNGGRTMTWMGIGNVEGRLLRKRGGVAGWHEALLLRAGIVGERLPPLRPSKIPLARRDILILATDGVDRNFTEGIETDMEPQQIAQEILARHSKGTDDALAFVARYVG
jgi:hypothetical protein